MKVFIINLLYILHGLTSAVTDFIIPNQNFNASNNAIFLRQIYHNNKFCAAAVISEYWLITSPYCLLPNEYEEWLVTIYTVRMGSKEEKHGLVSVYYFPNSTDIETINDGICLISVIGIIELLDPQSFITIANDSPQLQDIITIVEMKKGRDIRIYNTSMINTTMCAKHFEGSGFRITENMFCVARNKEYDCQDDSYLVATVKGTLVGILSAFGRNCSSENSPDVYINVVKYNNENVASMYNNIKYLQPIPGIPISGGDTAISITVAPHQAQIRRNGAAFCGATIISNYWLVSAAHCVTGSLKGAEIVTGSRYATGYNGAKHVINKLIVHPNFNRKTLNNDISLIKGNTAALYSRLIENKDVTLSQAVLKNIICNSGIKSISVYCPRIARTENSAAILKPLLINFNQHPIPLADFTPHPGEKVVISGFGQLGINQPAASLLQIVSISVVDRTECTKRYAPKSFKIMDSMFCAGRGQKAACPGDSGGPAVVREKLIGIVTGGYGCGSSNLPGVYTRIDKFRNWIIRQTGIS